MNFHDLKIARILVLTNRNGPDQVIINFDNLPTAFPIMKYPTSLKTEAQGGYGAQWAKEVFGIDPEVMEYV
jgi:hypothetical protein